MDKDKFLELLYKWKRYYDAMSEKAYRTGNNKLENYADDMWYYANRLMGRILRLCKEDPNKKEVSLEEVILYLDERKHHFLERSKRAYAGDNKRAAADFEALAKHSNRMKKRIITAWKEY